MKNFNETIPDTNLTRFTNQSTGAVTETAEQLPWKRATVESSEVIQGDHSNPNNWSYLVRRTNGPKGYMRYGKSFEYIGVLADFPHRPIPLAPSYLYNEVLSRMNEKVRGGIDLSIDAFQARQTKRMFDATANTELATRRYRYKASGLAQIGGSLWLQFMYGWRPLADTIYDAGTKLINHNLKRLEFQARSGTEVEPTNKEGLIPIHRMPEYAKFRIDGKGFAGVEMYIKLKASNDALQFLASWTTLNPVNIAWELVPYSFVVDWFYDIGGHLHGLETAILFHNSFDSGYVGFLQAGDHKGKISPGSVNQSGGGDFDYSYRQYRRVVLEKYPLPRAPSFRVNMGSGRMLNAAALLSQFLT